MADARATKHAFNMSYATQGSNDFGRSKSQKSEKSKRTWSLREEEILLASLKELVAQGWKSDNGFRAGYLNKLEEAIRREFPDMDIKVNPNIVSKLTSWKKNYYSLQGTLGRSGVGFNLKGDHMIDYDKEQWEQIVKIDGNAKMMRGKPWPYWEDWKEIFGKDRANGSNAEDIMEAVNDLYAKEKLGNLGIDAEYNVGLEDMFANEVQEDRFANDVAEDSVCQGEKVNHCPKVSGRKRKPRDEMQGIFELLSKMHEDTNARLHDLSKRIGYDVDLSKARKEVFDIVGNIPGLSLDDKFDICELLVKEVDRLDLFMELPESARPSYVMRLLKEKRKQ